MFSWDELLFMPKRRLFITKKPCAKAESPLELLFAVLLERTCGFLLFSFVCFAFIYFFCVPLGSLAVNKVVKTSENPESLTYEQRKGLSVQKREKGKRTTL